MDIGYRIWPSSRLSINIVACEAPTHRPLSCLIFTAPTSNCIEGDYISKRSTVKNPSLRLAFYFSRSLSRLSWRLPQASFMAASKLAEVTFYGVSVSDSLVSTLRFSYLFVQGYNFVTRCFLKYVCLTLSSFLPFT